MALVPVGSPKTPRRVKIELHKTDKPLDFSFLNISDLSEIEHESPRCSTEKKEDKKYDCKCIKISNNVLQDISNLSEKISEVLIDFPSVTWIDLSFNEISKIPESLCDLPNLHILYLHGNQIEDITQVDKLGEIPTLFKLTLHGNKISSEKGYRFYVLSKLPNLKNLDFSAVSKGDRQTAKVLEKITPAKKRKRKSEQ